MNKEKRRRDIGMVCVLVYRNYGSAYTNFALYNLIKDSGRSVLLITQPTCSDISPAQDDNFATFSYPSTDLANSYENREEMRALNSVCQSFLVGSDQLFNYEIYRQIDGVVKLDWVDDAKPKLAYAASFGINAILGDRDEREELRRSVRRFKAFSVREAEMIPIVRDQLGVCPVQVLDPIFLCDRRHFASLIDFENTSAAEGRLFAYILDPTSEKSDIITAACRALSLDYRAVSDMWRERDGISALWDIDTHTDVTNEEWLASIFASSFVITDSYHGLCFAILFNKPFLVLENELRGNDRFLSLLKLLSLEDRLIVRGDTRSLADILSRDINWARVNLTLEREISCSRHWFDNNIVSYR